MDEKIGCKDTQQLTEGKILPIFLKLVFPLFFITYWNLYTLAMIFLFCHPWDWQPRQCSTTNLNKIKIAGLIKSQGVYKSLFNISIYKNTNR